MSQRDKSSSPEGKKPSVEDKIAEILKTHGSLSSSLITRQINEVYRDHFNRKTTQRHLKEMMKQGCVIQNPAVGREQTYSYIGATRHVSEFYINMFWKNLDEIRKINASDSSFRAFRELRSLCKTWDLLYSSFESRFGEVERVLTERKRMGYDEREAPVEGYVSFPTKELKGLSEIEDLIGEVAEFLHEQFMALSHEGKSE
jgi:hypothetical protein